MRSLLGVCGVVFLAWVMGCNAPFVTGTGNTGGSGGSGGGGSGLCPERSCPADAPASGDSCSCFPGAECTFDLCGATGHRLTAKCEGEAWAVHEEDCPPTITNCYGSGIACAPGQLCTKRDLPGGGYEFACVEDECWPAPLDCACATAACPADHTCQYVNPWDFGENAGHMHCAPNF